MPILGDLSREDLYQRIWSTPIVQLAREFGLSDAAIIKRCRRLNIPTPGRGYWARKDVGLEVRITPLPILEKPPPALTPAETVAQAAPPEEWPAATKDLCERAQGLHATMKGMTVSYDGLVILRDPNFCEVKVAPSNVTRAAQIFHAILSRVEGKGVPFVKFRGKRTSGYFEKNANNIYVKVEEEVAEATGRQRSFHKVPTGKLTLAISDSHYFTNWHHVWKESAGLTAEDMVRKAAATILDRYDDLEKQRIKKEEDERDANLRWQREHAEKVRAAHAGNLERVMDQRRTDFFRAVEFARLHDDALRFVENCEARWLRTAPLTHDQMAWLAWARETVEAASVWKSGYPDPSRDGDFDRAAVPVAGPMPPTRNFPRPPTMPEPPNAPPSYSNPTPAGYPFWLRFGR